MKYKNFIPGQSRRTYIEGSSVIKGNGSPLVAKPIGRNEPCRCGSGKKSKNCCGSVTKYINSSI